jgi:O-antigen/teichoic acid export membrane protein
MGGLQKIFQGLQSAWIVYLIKGLGSLLSVALVFYLAQEKAGPPELLLATYGVQTFMPLLLLAVTWKRKLICLPAMNGAVWIFETKALLHIGGLFFVLQIGTLIGWGGDSLIASSLLGASEVSKLALVQRLFQFVTLPLMIINAPLWSAYADAHARNDKKFIKNTLKKSLILTLSISIITSAVVTALASCIFDLWTRGSIIVPLKLVLYYSIWAVLEATGSAFAMFLNGIGEIRIQLFFVSLFCMFALPLKFILVSNYGLPAIILATIISYIISHLIPIAFIFNRRIRHHIN